jgi:predicted HicB family RNase H-like nuclease
MAKKKTARRGRPYSGGETPKRYFRMSDVDYEAIKRQAEKDGKSISEWIRDCLLHFVKK